MPFGFAFRASFLSIDSVLKIIPRQSTFSGLLKCDIEAGGGGGGGGQKIVLDIKPRNKHARKVLATPRPQLFGFGFRRLRFDRI